MTMTTYRLLILTITMAISCKSLYAQGCSDAGICTAPSIRLTDTSVLSGDKKNTVTVGTVFGTAQYKVNSLGIHAEYVRRLGKLTLSGKVAYSYITGPLTSNSGLADAMFTAAYSFNDKFTPMIGLKLPFNDANKMLNGLTLPMAYQTSLGTTDLLAGFTYTFNNWGVALAWQQPLVQNNSTFIITDYPAGSIDSRYRSTKGFERRADVLARAYYNIRFNSKWLFTPGVLPIYHIGDDYWTDNTGTRTSIPGSQGLTLNTNVALRYTLNSSSYLRFTVGAPVMARKVRPEGLTKFGVILEYIGRL